MNGRKLEKVWYKISSTGCKWFNLNAPSTETPVSDPFLVNSLFSYSAFLSHWGNKMGNKELDLPVWMVGKWKKFGTKSAQQAANVSIEMPQLLKPLCQIHFRCIPFSPILPSSFTGVIRNWTSHYEWWESGKILGQNQLNRLRMVQFECPEYWNPCVRSIFGAFPFLLFFLPLSLG